MSKTETTPAACCMDMSDALEPGTDAEGYGPLMRRHSGEVEIVTMAGHLQHIDYCPWCGTKVEVMDHAE
jgi:hypothetical protein